MTSLGIWKNIEGSLTIQRGENMAEFSGRKYIVICAVSTYCIAIIGTMILAIMKLTSVEVFLATLTGIGSLVMYIVKAYFDDKDRTIQPNGGQK